MALRAVTSIYYLYLNFPTPRGVRVIRGNQYEARMCYTTSVRSAPAEPKVKRTAEEAALNEATLTIGVFEGRSELDPRLPAP